jgi:hypothetical protein
MAHIIVVTMHDGVDQNLMPCPHLLAGIVNGQL